MIRLGVLIAVFFQGAIAFAGYWTCTAPCARTYGNGMAEIVGQGLSFNEPVRSRAERQLRDYCVLLGGQGSIPVRRLHTRRAHSYESGSGRAGLTRWYVWNSHHEEVEVELEPAGAEACRWTITNHQPPQDYIGPDPVGG